jgi:uncharacterized protein (TIGR04255 family)
MLNYELRRSHHAIGECSVHVKFFQQLPPHAFAEIVTAVSGLGQRLNLPAPVNVQLFQIPIGNVPIMSPTPMGTIGFQRFAPDGEVERSLIVNGDTVSFTFRDYVRWEDHLDEIVAIFDEIAQIFIKSVPAIHSVRLQYINELRSRQPNTELAGEIFRSGTRWVSPIGFDTPENWHCHTGKFFNIDQSKRHLVNVNADITTRPKPDGVPSNFVQLIIMAGVHFDIPGSQPLIVSADSCRATIRSVLDEAHTLEKRVLAEVVSDEYLKAMGALT